MLCSFIDLVIRDILVPHRVQNITNDHGSYMVEQNEEPHRYDGDRDAVADEENRLVLQGVTNGDCGDGKSSVGKNHGPPTQMKVDSPRIDDLSMS
jgi:hypothetical protein